MPARKAAVAKTAPAVPPEGQQAIDTEGAVQADGPDQQDQQDQQQDQPAIDPEVPAQADGPDQQDQPAVSFTLKVKNTGHWHLFEPLSRTELPAGKTVRIVAKTEKALQAIKANIRQMNDLAGSTVLQVKE